MGGGFGSSCSTVSRLYEHTSIIVTRFKIRADEPEGNLRTSWRSASVNADGVFFVKHQRAEFSNHKAVTGRQIALSGARFTLIA